MQCLAERSSEIQRHNLIAYIYDYNLYRQPYHWSPHLQYTGNPITGHLACSIQATLSLVTSLAVYRQPYYWSPHLQYTALQVQPDMNAVNLEKF
jgi:hypothetical protein